MYREGLKGKITAFSGTHGTGKTTAVFAEAHRRKVMAPGADVGIVMETARRCPLGFLSDGRQIIGEAAQRWIFAAQIVAELEAAAQYGVVISDRTVVDAIAYTMVGGHTDLARGMMEIAKKHMEVYREIRVLTIDGNDRCLPDGRRNTDPVLRQRVEDALLEIYRVMGVEVKRQ